jgi:dihydrofolate reductase
MVNVVLACCRNGGIGINNTLPWSIKDELKLFKMITNNATIVMGYNTWKSLPQKPLINRINVVLTTSIEKKEKILKEYNVIVLSSIEEALQKYKNTQCYYIGGASIYNYLIKNNLITNLYISIIHNEYKTDTKIDIDKLYNFEHFIVSRQVFKDFTHLHIKFQTDVQLLKNLDPDQIH